jgi:acetoin utilization protein AcuB
MNITELMKKVVITVEMDDSLHIVKEIFDNTGFHHLLVVDSEKLLGVISDRDLLKSLNPKIGTAAETEKDLSCLNKKAHQIMSRSPICLNISSSVYDAIGVFNSHKISCIPVVDDKDIPIGIVSWRDVMKVLGEKIGNV